MFVVAGAVSRLVGKAVRPRLYFGRSITRSPEPVVPTVAAITAGATSVDDMVRRYIAFEKGVSGEGFSAGAALSFLRSIKSDRYCLSYLPFSDVFYEVAYLAIFRHRGVKAVLVKTNSRRCHVQAPWRLTIGQSSHQASL